jgi:choline-sulfatase
MPATNLLFIFSDEHNREMAGCYGHPMVQTPNIDRLAARGTRFDAAYTNCPICVPARASFAAGRYVNKNKYWDNAFPYDGKEKGWGHRLIEAGHDVVSIGKLHYRCAGDDDGFSEKIVPLYVVDGVGDVVSSVRDETPVRVGTRNTVETAGPGESTYLSYDEDIAARSVQWLRDAAARQQADAEAKPFVLFSSFVCPHPPFFAPPELYDMYPLDQIELPIQNSLEERPQHPALAELRRVFEYDQPFTEEQIRRVTAAYYGACTHLDRQIGKLLDALEQSGLAENTRVIYTSDHGENMGRRGLWGKFTMYEESAGIPLVIAGPGVPEGKTVSDPVTLVDCYPTIIEAVGHEFTASDEADLPGRSLWKTANGEIPARVAFSEYHAVGSTSGSYMLRAGNYKLIYYVNHASQLFDLTEDPQELNDLVAAGGYEEVVARLEASLREIVDPEATDAEARADQAALIEKHGGRDAVLNRRTFVNSPVPGEDPSWTEE